MGPGDPKRRAAAAKIKLWAPAGATTLVALRYMKKTGADAKLAADLITGLIFQHVERNLPQKRIKRQHAHLSRSYVGKVRWKT